MKVILFLLLMSSSILQAAAPPGLQLANQYHEKIQLSDYWVSEKYDGVRAYWDGSKLFSRQGNTINAPLWFTDALPSVSLDGELWLARAKFDQLSGIVRRQSPLDANWLNIKYMVFDLPDSPLSFDQRLIQMEVLIKNIDRTFIRLVKQEKISSHTALMQKLDQIVADKGEGLMLHRGSSMYQHTRSDDLLKLKKYSDAEARVLAHFPGKGKYQGMMGSMLVETADSKRFKIGTGFSDQQRKTPPPIGSIITFRYLGLTSKGIPRFASFMRIREQY